MLTNLRALRDEKGVSQQKLADALGLSQSSINDYENRGIEPDITTLKRMADYFSTSIDYIVAYTDIRRRVEKISEFDLNEREENMIREYRRLTESGRKILEDMAMEMNKR